LAQLSPGAEIVESALTVAAVFPSWAPLNNAILLGEEDDDAATAAVTMTSLYAAAGISQWALWVPSSADDLSAPDRMPEVGALTRDTTTLVMHADIPGGLRPHEGVVETSIATLELVDCDPPVPASRLGAPDGVPGLSAWVMVRDGVAVATTWSFLHRDDCGIYAVETLPAYRRRGVARALVEHVLHSASRRGARTTSLQSTEMGRPLYERIGFRSAGRYEEWVPG
jgi:GNAT superfamily N-acetyltransferase